MEEHNTLKERWYCNSPIRVQNILVVFCYLVILRFTSAVIYGTDCYAS